jgi:signal transduction histidine kinase
MFSSLRFRLWLTYALIVGVVITLAGVAVFFYLARNPSTDRLEFQRLRLISTLLLQRGQAWSVSPRSDSNQRLQENMVRIDTATGLRIVIFDASGRVIADSRPDSSLPIPVLSRLLERQSGSLPIYQDDERNQWLYAISPLQDDYHLMVAAPRTRAPVLGVLRDEFLQPYFRGVIVALVLSLILSIWIARWVTAPLERITTAAQDVSEGAYRQIDVEGPNEVKALATAFNDMVERVQDSQRSQRDFVANVSHDLKTPITSIQGFAQAILDGTADDPQATQQSARVIYDEAGRMNRMVAELLDLARLDAGIMHFERALLSVSDLLDTIVEQFAYQSEQEQVRIFWERPVALPTITGDVDRLSQVFTNLVDNALKHTPAGGVVSLLARQSDGYIEVYVADSGPGIPPGELERIFERFYQTDKARRGGASRGVGLGLAIASEIVQAHDGEILALNSSDLSSESASGLGELTGLGGGVFIVKLPVSDLGGNSPTRRKHQG